MTAPTTVWEQDPKTLTETQLNTHYSALLNRENAILKERQRRQALPFVWSSETSMIQQMREAMSIPTPGKEGEPPAWKQPTNLLTAYIDGDKVTHNAQTWVADGDGAIMHAPGTIDPVMGERWTAAEQAVV